MNYFYFFSIDIFIFFYFLHSFIFIIFPYYCIIPCGSAGFSLQTPLVNGQLRTSRYSMYYSVAMDRLKFFLRKGFYNSKNVYETLSAEKIEKINDTITLDEILKLVGKDFYVILPCPSIRNVGTKFEGTRLTLVNHPPDGMEFTIRTPGFFGRWLQFERELDFCFQKLIDALTLVQNENKNHNVENGKQHLSNDDDNKKNNNDNKNHDSKNHDNNNNHTNCHDNDDGNDSKPTISISSEEAMKSNINNCRSSDSNLNLKNLQNSENFVSDQHKEILKMSLELFYFWINFAPLTRGTAACGYSSLLSIMLSCGVSFSQPMPISVQLDWEAIFAKDCSDFAERMYMLLPLEISTIELDDFPKVEKTISTMRQMIEALL